MSLAYLLRRLIYTAVTLLLVSLLVFVITQVLPGNAAQMVLGEFATPEVVRALEIGSASMRRTGSNTCAGSPASCGGTGCFALHLFAGGKPRRPGSWPIPTPGRHELSS